MEQPQPAFGWLAHLSRRLFKLVSLTILLAHFALTLLYVFPPNPLKLPVDLFLDGTIGVYAKQNWSLFAPNPIASNQDLLAKCLTADEASLEMTAIVQGKRTEGWTDLSAPFWFAFQQNRFAAYDRLIRPQTNFVRSYLGGGLHLAFWDHACNKRNEEEACRTYEEGVQNARKAVEPSLRKVGSSFCRDFDGDRPLTHVSLRVRLTPAIPWSERGNVSFVSPSSDLNLGVYPIDKDVATTGLFRSAALR